MTQWTPAQRADAIGKALALGADKASEMTGIPRRTVSSWVNRERPAPELDAMIVDSREAVAAKLWEAVTIGTEAVLAGLRDPKARLGDKANALRIVAEQYALLTGGVTERTEALNINTDLGPVTTAEVRAELLEWMTRIENATDAELEEHEAKVGRVLEIAGRVLLAGQEDE